MNKSINQKIEELKDLIISELSSNVTFVSINITSEVTDFKVRERSPENLKKSSISMKNIKGDWIK